MAFGEAAQHLKHDDGFERGTTAPNGVRAVCPFVAYKGLDACAGGAASLAAMIGERMNEKCEQLPTLLPVASEP